MRLVLLALPLLLLAPCSASASPYGGARLQSAQIDIRAGAGLSLRRPDLLQVAEGVAIHGAVCRLPGRAEAGAVGVRVQHLDNGGRVLSEADVAMADVLGPRNRACGFYTVRTNWTVAATDTVRVCADRRGRGTCLARAAAS